MAKDSFLDGALFTPTVLKNLTTDGGNSDLKTASVMTSSNIGTTSSFRYDPPGTGLKSTQQIPLDFSKFENHTFFNSAESKVNVAFDKIINYYPFDGKKNEVESFFDNLTGFERWVYDEFPKNVGYLHFSGTQLGETVNSWSPTGSKDPGVYIQVNDFEGSTLSTIGKIATGKSLLSPQKNSLSIESHIFISEKSNHNQIIFQKLTGSNSTNSVGFTLGLSSSASPESASIVMIVSSGSSHISASMPITKGKFNHVCASLERKYGFAKISLFTNSELISTSSHSWEMGKVYTTSPFMIGSGTTHFGGTYPNSQNGFIPNQTFSGSLDDFRVHHKKMNKDMIFNHMSSSIYADDTSLMLYFKFNEPSGSYTGGDLILDASGNSLHSRASNLFTSASNDSRGKIHSSLSAGYVDTPLNLEVLSDAPILFPHHSQISSLNSQLLVSASLYDANNPNMITKLIPKHYLQEAAQDEGFQDLDKADVGSAYEGSASGSPGEGKIPSPQIIAALLFTWAKHFDEIKMFADHFSKLLTVDYVEEDTIADQFLPFLGRYYGFNLPSQYVNASIEQYIDGKNIAPGSNISQVSLQYVQNQIWRRILKSMPEIVRSKGTIHSIKALLRSMGINPNSSFRFREYGGSRTMNLTDARINRSEVSSLLDFTGSRSDSAPSGIVDHRGVNSKMPYLTSPFLSGTRIEKGIPLPKGDFITNNYGENLRTDWKSDGLFTSGSWTYEAIYKFEAGLPHQSTQSLVRLHTTGTASPSNKGALLANLIATSGSEGNITLYTRPGVSGNIVPLSLQLTGANIFDGNKWHVSFGRVRSDMCGSVISSSYFIRVGRQSFGDVKSYTTTSSLYLEEGSGKIDEIPWQYVTSLYNISGSYLAIGSQSIEDVTSNGKYLHSNATGDGSERTTDFDGKVGHIRFWSKDLSENADKEHVSNYKSLGVSDPLTNFNFVTTNSGSFGRLRLDVSTDQQVTQSNDFRGIEVFDFSQNSLHMTGSGFEPSMRVIKPEQFYFSILDPKFDELTADNKIRIRSFQNYENVLNYGGEVGPIYELPQFERVFDDTRFSIDVSLVQALNEDMINLFSTFDALDNVLGNPELVFSTSYPDLERLRSVYFNRLTDKIKFKAFFEFFKWFDTSVTDIISRLIPRKTNFLGVNFVIESHMLERAKMDYSYGDIYIGENDRHSLKGTIQLRQLVGEVKRF